MFQHVTTLTDFFLEEHRKYQKHGNLTLLLTQIENAAKIIASHVRKTGLVDILGQTGKKNVFDEEIQRLDDFSNDLFVKLLLSSDQVFAVASEELEKPIYAPPKHAGEYIVYFDPLDGSSNIDTNSPIGTIFSIYHKKEGLLQNGNKQIAAGYVMYGTSVMFVYTSGNGVYGFTLDPSMGSFLLSHPQMKIPQKGSIYSLNEGRGDLFSISVSNYLTHIKKTKQYTSRYTGTFVADVHRTLLKGGIFLYPEDAKHPDGKLRLLHEVNSMALIMEQAGGVCYSGNKKTLTIIPQDIHQQVPVVLGSQENVKEFLTFQKT